MADDLGTAGSRGARSARDQYALAGDGPGARRSRLGRGQETAG